VSHATRQFPKDPLLQLGQAPDLLTMQPGVAVAVGVAVWVAVDVAVAVAVSVGVGLETCGPTSQ